MLTAIKLIATLSLLFDAAWNWRANKRREIRDEYNWWMSPCVEGESFPDLPEIIRAGDGQ